MPFELWQLGVGGAGVVIGLREAFKFVKEWKGPGVNGQITNGSVKKDLAEHGVKLDAILVAEKEQTEVLHSMDKNIAIMATQDCPCHRD